MDRFKKIKSLIIDHWVLVIILILAAFMRLYKIDGYMTFLGDEGRDALVVKRMIVDHKLTLLGPTASVGGFFLGPIYYYFMLPFLWIFRLNPVGPAIMVALFGVAAVWLVYRAGKEFFNELTGLIAAAFYAISPLVITYSHSSWNPNLVPFFSLLYIWSLVKAVKINHWRWWFLSGICLGIGLQLHYLFTFLIPIGVVFLFFYQRKLTDLKKWGAIILGGIVGWLPYLAFELRHGFPNTRTLIDFILHGKETGFVGSEYRKRISEIAFRLFGRLVFNFPESGKFHFYENRRGLLLGWRYFVILTALLVFFLLLAQAGKKRKASHFLLMIWPLFGIGLFIFYQRAVYDYYLGIMFSLPFLLVANLIAFLLKNKYLKFFGILAFLLIVYLNFLGWPFSREPNYQVRQVQEVARMILEKAENKPFNFALVTVSNSDHAYRYYLEIWGNKPMVIENFDNDPQRKSVTDQLLVACEVDNCKPLGLPLWEVAGFGRAEIVGEWPAGLIKVMKLKHWEVEDEEQNL